MAPAFSRRLTPLCITSFGNDSTAIFAAQAAIEKALSACLVLPHEAAEAKTWTAEDTAPWEALLSS